MEASIQATIDDLNQYLQGNVTAMGLIDTLQDTINFLKDSEGISENKDFDLKKYLAEGKLLKEEDYSDLDRKTVVASGKKPYVKGVKVNSQVLAKELEYVLGKLSDEADKDIVYKAIAATSIAPEVGEEEIFDKIKDYLPKSPNTEGGYAINGAFLRAYYLH